MIVCMYYTFAPRQQTRPEQGSSAVCIVGPLVTKYTKYTKFDLNLTQNKRPEHRHAQTET